MDEQKSNTKLFQSSVDRISDLPENITENILRFLPLRDAVRTCVLSKPWRYKWVTIPRLAFNDDFGKPLPGKSSLTRDKLLLNIFQVLLCHHGQVDSFVLSVPWLESCFEINQFIFFLSGKEVQNLHIQIERGKDHELPSSLFSCVQLRNLHLGSCIFKPPPPLFKGFSKLTVLQFVKVNFAADINIFISSCPLLHRLTLEKCTSLDYLEINAPNLRFFHFEGILQTLCFKSTSLLETVTIDAYKESFSQSKPGRVSNLNNIFSCLPAIKSLYASHIFAKFLTLGGIPDKLPTTLLKQLRVLVLHEISFGAVDEVSCALCLIRSCPNLQELVIGVCGNSVSDEAPILELLEAQHLSDCTLNQLQEVKFNSFHGSRPELKFVKLLLVASPVLKKMSILPEKASAEVVIKTLKKLTGFQRASPNVKVKYSDVGVQSSQTVTRSSYYY